MKTRRIVMIAAMAMGLPMVSEASSKTQVVDYRWRNDNGSESEATWKTADPHTPITGVKRDENIRLRFTFCSNGAVAENNPVRYATSTNGPWTDVVAEDVGRPFRITATTWYANGDPTTPRMPVPPGKTFVSGKCVESPGNSFVVSLANNSQYTEAEVCLQATPYALRNATYYLLSETYSIPLYYPQLTIEDTEPTNAPTDFYVDDSDSGAGLVGGGYVSVSSCTNGAWLGRCKCVIATSETVSVSFRWVPTLPETGEYNVYALWTHSPTRSRQVPYTVTYAGGTSPAIVVNQCDPGLAGQWNPLGTYTFNAGTNGWVEMGGNDGLACADAIRLERVVAPLDADGDGMLDAWENTYLGGTNASPTEDEDSDGMSNFSEFKAGTFPNESESVLAMVGLTGSGQNLDLKWLSVDGKKYDIQKSTNLTQGFPLTEAIGIEGIAPTNIYSVTVGTGGVGFYRVKLVE